MHQYRCQGSFRPVTEVSNSPVHPVPRPGGRAPPTRFKVERPAYKSVSSDQEFTIEAEYRKYVLGDLSSLQTDSLKFWEVRFHVVGWRNDSHPNRLIRPSSLHYLPSRWIIFRFRPRQYPVSVCFRQQRRQTLRSETG